MRRASARNTLAFVVGVVVLALAPASATAAGSSGTIIFGRDGALWQWSLEGGKNEPKRVRKLALVGQLDGLKVDGAGRHAVLRAGKSWYWLELGSEKTERLDCVAQPTLSANGRCVLCQVSDGKSLLYAFGRKAKKHSVRGAGPWSFAGRSGGDRVLVVDGDQILLTAPRRRRFKSTVVAEHAPKSLSVSPTGGRAVGFFADNGSKPAGFYTFRIGRKGARRRLLEEGEAIAWSANGAWLLLSRKDEACLIRAVGGEYKCWNGYRAAAVSGDGREAFLIKDEGGKSLYRGLQKGVKAAMPKLLLRKVDTAAWTPSSPTTTP